MPDPIEKPDSSPIKPGGPAKGPAEQQIGEGQEKQAPFKMPESPQAPEAAGKTAAPSPMEIAGQQNTPRVSPEELSGHVQKVQQTLQEAHTKMSDPALQKQMTQEHYNALSQVSTKMNGDMKTIAENSDGKFQAPVDDPKENGATKVLNWINGSQKTLTGALNYLSTTKKPNVASYMKMQYAVQRATQRAELFSSVISSSVSGIKTLMSTQLG